MVNENKELESEVLEIYKTTCNILKDMFCGGGLKFNLKYGQIINWNSHILKNRY